MTDSDQLTADAFATSWNNLPPGTIYTSDQFKDWMAPLNRRDIERKEVLELGCGNGSLLVHCAEWRPARMVGIDLGASVEAARKNLATYTFVEVIQANLVDFNSPGFDIVYCIGVLHHLRNPRAGLTAVIRNTKAGGRFHCWVYAREGNSLIIHLVEPIRKVASRLPWWFTKHLIATPLVAPYFVYAKTLALLHNRYPAAAHKWLRWTPLRDYSLWIAQREFRFFRHVAFDQLVTPQTAYISRQEIELWLSTEHLVEPGSVYIIPRNGNSWKFGGAVVNRDRVAASA